MEKNKKYSYKRSLIYTVMKESKVHPSAEWVYNQVKFRIPNISIGTVYRNIAAFKEEGAVVSVGVVNGQERYDADISPHTHFVCEDCGVVMDIGSLQQDKRHCNEIAEKAGVRIKSTTILYRGLCQNCVLGNTVNK